MIQTAPNHRYPPSLTLVRASLLVASAEDRPAPPAVFRAGVNTRALTVLKHAAFGFSLWFTMPLAIWLSSGWVGLFILLQAFVAAANLRTTASLTPHADPQKGQSSEIQILLATEISPGDSPCALLNAKSR